MTDIQNTIEDQEAKTNLEIELESLMKRRSEITMKLKLANVELEAFNREFNEWLVKNLQITKEESTNIHLSELLHRWSKMV